MSASRERDERAWAMVAERIHRERGVFGVRFQTCPECRNTVATALSTPALTGCSEHT